MEPTSLFLNFFFEGQDLPLSPMQVEIRQSDYAFFCIANKNPHILPLSPAKTKRPTIITVRFVSLVNSTPRDT